MTQAPDPVQAPLHCPKFQPLVALAVKVTCVPGAKLALHVPGQSMPAGELVTVPPGLPITETARA